MSFPLVTLRISAYNHEKYIKQAVLSLINQTYKNTEIIVIDDGSQDKTPEILQLLADEYKFTFIQQENKGLIKTLNRIIGMANGKYIAGCASDDFMPLDKIEKQVNFLESNDTFAVCGGNSVNVDNNGKPFIVNMPEDKTYRVIEFKDVFLHDKSIPAGTAMIRKSVIDEVGGYSTEFPIEDQYLWLKITSKGYKIARLNTVLQYYRQHDNNISNNISFMIENTKNCINSFGTHELYPIAINNFYARIFNKYILIDKKQSITALRKINWLLLDFISYKQIFLGFKKLINVRKF